MDTTEELERYFERDIVEYLDRVVQYNKTGDYTTDQILEQIHESLKTKDTVIVIKRIKKLIEEFNDTATTDPYKQIRLNKIIEISDTIKTYCAKNPDSVRLKHVSELLDEELELKQQQADYLEVLSKLDKEKEEKEKEKEEKHFQIKKQLNSRLSIARKTITISILKKDLKTAIKAYKELKIIFTRYPSEYAEEKREIYNDMISYFMQIKKTMNTIKQKQARASTLREIQDLEERQKYTQLHLEEIQKIIDSIKESTRKKDFTSAKEKIIELKHLSSQIPEKHKVIKEALDAKINIINQRIEFIKRVNKQKNVSLELLEDPPQMKT